MKHLAETLPPPTTRRPRKRAVADIVLPESRCPVTDGAPRQSYQLTGDPVPLENIVAHVSLGTIVQQERFRVLHTHTVPFIDIDLEDGASIPARSAAIKRVAEYATAHPGFGCRVYLTRAGIRLLVTSHELPPETTEMVDMMRDLGADEKYVKFCIEHRHYAARLDPKPERCDNPALNYAVCEFVWYIGSGAVGNSALAIINVHDKETRAKSGGPLA